MELQMAVAFMLAWPYGAARVMSSYYWDQKYVNGKVISERSFYSERN